jgi:hypothetical protein
MNHQIMISLKDYFDLSLNHHLIIIFSLLKYVMVIIFNNKFVINYLNSKFILNYYQYLIYLIHLYYIP